MVFLGMHSTTVKGSPDSMPPKTPQFFSVELSGDEVMLRWQENTEWDMFSYELGVRSASETELTDIKLTGLRHSYPLENVEPGEQYFVSLASRDISGNTSEFTEEIGFRVPDKKSKGFGLHGWLPGTSDQLDGVVSLEKNSSLFSSVSPFEYALEGDGSISRRASVLSDESVERIQKEGVLRIPSITNNFDVDGKSTEVLLDEVRRNRMREEIVKLVEENGYDGIDIDYENVGPEAKDVFTGFIEDLARDLRENNKRLSVTLQSKRSDAETWDGVGAQDFEALGRVADEVRIMSYDFSRTNTSPGPIAPIRWYEEVLEYAVSKIPAEKVVAGVPTYAYRWCANEKASPCPTDGLVWEGVKNIVEKYDPRVEWSGEYQSPWFEYTDDQENTYIVYFENYQSLEEKLKVVEELGVSGVALWRLGNEDPQMYEVLASRIEASEALANVRVEPRDEEIELFFSDDRIEEKAFRVYFAAKGEEYRYVDVIGESSYVIPTLQNGIQYSLFVEQKDRGDLIDSFFDGNSAEPPRDALRFVVSPQDLAFPGTITDLKIEDVGTDTVDFSFSAVGDEYNEGFAESFDLRYADFPISEENFNDATRYEAMPSPSAPGEQQRWQIRGLIGGVDYHFAIKAIDEAGNTSMISNVVEAQTIDVEAPAMPAVSAVIAGDEEIEIIWKANQEKDLNGYRVYFRTEKSAYHVVDLARNKNHLVIPGVKNNQKYEVAVAAVDVVGNVSDRTADALVVPKSGNALTRFSEDVLLDKEKIKGSLYVFGDKVINERALPYLAMLAVLIVNIFIYYSFKGEILRMVKRSAPQPVHQKTRVHSHKVSDMRRRVN